MDDVGGRDSIGHADEVRHPRFPTHRRVCGTPHPGRKPSGAAKTSDGQKPVWLYGPGWVRKRASARRRASPDRGSSRRPAARVVGATPPSRSAPRPAWSVTRSGRVRTGAHAAAPDPPARPVDLDDDVVVGAVRPGAEARLDVAHVAPETVVEVRRSHHPLVGQQERQRVVERERRRADRPDEVGRQHRVPQRGVSFRRDRRHRRQPHLVGRVAVVPLRLDLPRCVPVGVDGVDLPDALVGEHDPMPRLRPGDLAGAGRAEAVPHLGDLVDRIDGLDEAHGPRVGPEPLLEQRPPAVDRAHPPLGGDAVAEAFVEAAFAGRSAASGSPRSSMSRWTASISRRNSPWRRWVTATDTHVTPPVGTAAPPGSVICSANEPATPTTSPRSTAMR